MTIYAFDVLVSDDQDVRKLPLSMRKTNLTRLLAQRVRAYKAPPASAFRLGPFAFWRLKES
jgi:bifunctional non-homologous end joining protein LigD